MMCALFLSLMVALNVSVESDGPGTEPGQGIFYDGLGEVAPWSVARP